MIKLIYCLHRREDISEEEFHRYWLLEHGPLVRKHATALRIARYVQSHTRTSDLNSAFKQSRGCAQAFDGVAELWWESESTLSAAMTSPEGQEAGKALLEDEARFIDFSRCSIFITEEHEIVGGEG